MLTWQILLYFYILLYILYLLLLYFIIILFIYYIVCVHAHVGQRSTLGIIFQVPPTLFLRQGLASGSQSIGPGLLASRPRDPPPQCLGYKHELPRPASLCACAISACEGGPSSDTEPVSEPVLDFPISQPEETDLILLSKKEKRGRKGEERGGRGR